MQELDLFVARGHAVAATIIPIEMAIQERKRYKAKVTRLSLQVLAAVIAPPSPAVASPCILVLRRTLLQPASAAKFMAHSRSASVSMDLVAIVIDVK